MEHLTHAALSLLIPLCELMGIAVVAVSAVSAFARWVRVLLTHRRDDIQFRLAAGLALSLEFKMAAEILKTVLVRQLSELVTLGIVIVLRALLSALIHLEMRHYSPKNNRRYMDEKTTASPADALPADRLRGLNGGAK